MLFAAHIIAGGVVGEAIGNPFLAFLAGVVIHLCLDAIPHYDNPDKGKMTWRQWVLTLTDVAVGLFIVLYIMKPDLKLQSSFYWGALGGIIIDVFDVVPYWNLSFRKTKIGKVVHAIHSKLHAKSRPGFIFGVMTQVVTIAIFLAIYLKAK